MIEITFSMSICKINMLFINDVTIDSKLSFKVFKNNLKTYLLNTLIEKQSNSLINTENINRRFVSKCSMIF